MSVSLDVIALIGTTLAAVPELAEVSNSPRWLDPQEHGFPAAFYYSMPDRRHYVGIGGDIEIEGTARIEIVFLADQMGKIETATHAARDALAAAFPTFRNTLKVDIDGAPITGEPAVFEADGTYYGASQIDVFWSYGVTA